MFRLAASIFLLTFSFSVFCQKIDEPFSKKEMKKDLAVFKKIRQKVNSGLYKYRSREEIDSIYTWAENEIENNAITYCDFFKIICRLTDYEGSLHNSTHLPKEFLESLNKEENGYFPYPLKWIEGKWRMNFNKGEIPLGAEVYMMNGMKISDIISDLYKFYTTDGKNITGKRIGIRKFFSVYFRLNYGIQKDFKVTYRINNGKKGKTKIISSVSLSEYLENFNKRYSKPYDQIYYDDLTESQKYKYDRIDSLTGILTIHTFSMGNEVSKEHKKYHAFLDSTFTKVRKDSIKNLIVDVRQNGGGTDPNDVVTYSYLASRNFQESRQCWIVFNKIPMLRYYNISAPRFLRWLGVGKFNRHFRKRFPIQKGDMFLMSSKENEKQIRKPSEKSFTGRIYLLVSPAVASAGSLFAGMVAGNTNTITIGEETMGGYYGHNGHTSFEYILPKSKLVTEFSIENIEQDVVDKSNQIFGRGVIPDFIVSQSFEDFLENKDTQMEFVLDLIKKTASH